LDDLLTHHVQAVFFPHGIGHLLGLDVHDMEDLGDRAGYATGRERRMDATRQALRLDRPLRANMAVTIEPGFYQIPELLAAAHEAPHVRPLIDFGELHHFRDVRGIRIEDDVLLTQDGATVLSHAAAKEIADIEELFSE
jgi:Xaa-Pro aminopeptidase